MKHGKPSQWKVVREATTRLNMLVEQNAEEKYPSFAWRFQFVQGFKIYVAYTWSLAFFGSEHQTSWKRKKERKEKKKRPGNRLQY